jgi:hypothetical protein
MCECGGCGHGRGHCHEWGSGGGFGYGPSRGYGRSFVPLRGSKDEIIDDLQEYKENLEAEIRRLEKRIGSLRSKSATE